MQKDNFTPIHNEILEGLAYVNLSAYEWRVLCVILRKTYGFEAKHGNRKKSDWIAYSQLEEATGINKSNISRALNGLKEKGIIFKNFKCMGLSKVFMKVIYSDNKKVIDVDNSGGSKVIDSEQKVIDSDNPKLSIQTNTKENNTKENNTKEIYNQFVYLTKREHEDLVQFFGESGTKEKIQALNDYLGSKGKKYKSHYHTILNWDNLDRKKRGEPLLDKESIRARRKKAQEFLNEMKGAKENEQATI